MSPPISAVVVCPEVYKLPTRLRNGQNASVAAGLLICPHGIGCYRGCEIPEGYDPRDSIQSRYRATSKLPEAGFPSELRNWLN